MKTATGTSKQPILRKLGCNEPTVMAPLPAPTVIDSLPVPTTAEYKSLSSSVALSETIHPNSPRNSFASFGSPGTFEPRSDR